MKQIIFSIVCGLVLSSCDPEWVFTPPHQGRWILQNNTDKDLMLYLNLICINEWGNECDVHIEYDWPSNGTIVEKSGSRYSEDIGFESLFRYGFEEVVGGSIYITPADGDEILNEWVYGVNNGAHNIFNEGEWHHQEWSSDDEASFTVFHHEWTFTITDEDIGVVE